MTPELSVTGVILLFVAGVSFVGWFHCFVMWLFDDPVPHIEE